MFGRTLCRNRKGRKGLVVPERCYGSLERHPLCVFECLGRFHSLSVFGEWSCVGYGHIIAFGGRTLLETRKGGITELMAQIFPQRKIWFSDKIRYKEYNTPQNRKCLVDELGHQKAHIGIYDDWNNLVSAQMYRSNLRGLLEYCKRNSNLLMEAYPEFNWDPLKANFLPQNFWKKGQEHFCFVSKLQHLYGIEGKEDWYRLSLRQISVVTGRSAKKRDLVSVLEGSFPEEVWNFGMYGSAKMIRAQQRWLLLNIKKIFKDKQVIEEYHFSNIRRKSGNLLDVDIYVPALKLAFEFHGEQHYYELPQIRSFYGQQKRDVEKENLCRLNGIYLVVVPFWWDNTLPSLIATIQHKFPQLIPSLHASSAHPISLHFDPLTMKRKNSTM
eukprot:TRINITY_DN15275_c0_g1_i1.p1 TRINITY_DN15275_c0_g1~~TRINITY_DN15275_c0_g1_i1.p1  ORF type:complete len:384 (-),score=69.59 TRINITY_DN15275_c0_g1_i1:14-1165(-)